MRFYDDVMYLTGVVQFGFGYAPTNEQYICLAVIIWPASGVLNPSIFLLGTFCRRAGYVSYISCALTGFDWGGGGSNLYYGFVIARLSTKISPKSL